MHTQHTTRVDGLTECSRRQQREDNTIARSVPFKHLTLHQRLGRVRAKFAPHLLLRLPERECLRLSEEVGEQDPVVVPFRQRVVRRRWREEVGGDELRALVHELIERVLAVLASCAPDDGLWRRMMRWSEFLQPKNKGRTPVS